MKNTKTYSPALAAERNEAERSEAELPGVGADQGGAGRPNPEVVARAKPHLHSRVQAARPGAFANGADQGR